jgi:hypothetical protein
MTSEPANQGGQFLSTVLRFLRIFTLNSWRRLVIVGHYTVICLHQQRLRRAWCVLGKQIHQAVEGGEVNPMLTEEVKDKLTRAQVIKETKERHSQAIAALREKIRSSRAGEEPPAPEAEPSPTADTGPEQPQG